MFKTKRRAGPGWGVGGDMLWWISGKGRWCGDVEGQLVGKGSIYHCWWGKSGYVTRVRKESPRISRSGERAHTYIDVYIQNQNHPLPAPRDLPSFGFSKNSRHIIRVTTNAQSQEPGTHGGGVFFGKKKKVCIFDSF
jgi:hypothetical protein